MAGFAAGVVASLAFIGSAQAAQQVDLQPYVNANVNFYSGGSSYPYGLHGTSVNIGGVDFDLASAYDAGLNYGTGIIQLSGSTPSAVSIAASASNVDIAYVILNSTRGTFDSVVGNLTFRNGQNLVSYALREGVNIRDHFPGSFNNVATDLFASESYSYGERYDVYAFDISALGGDVTGIDFSSTGAGDPAGSPFLAAITLDNRAPASGGGDAVGGVPEPATWALMISGFGLAGASLRSRRLLRQEIA
ncbi:PEPxxWA-CTERM sorting domain-containing protein [Phenylobacterium sp.]|uniref:PEPxxWA-CTERM sorting domain-containing protein n=1 Tax=Phenylobacterium sp. TaxID=1871053 RepID=UPI0025EEE000|nr:PEPxxWA-CTERM sorting domain-containing protein [Phenylobacterium sp.]